LDFFFAVSYSKPTLVQSTSVNHDNRHEELSILIYILWFFGDVTTAEVSVGCAEVEQAKTVT
jgi:hypothetical protein